MDGIDHESIWVVYEIALLTLGNGQLGENVS
jgi:hypothetical protein